MGWASEYIDRLQARETVQLRPRGNSMKGTIESGQLCTVEPVVLATLKVGDIVLCKVNGTRGSFRTSSADIGAKSNRAIVPAGGYRGVSKAIAAPGGRLTPTFDSLTSYLRRLACFQGADRDPCLDL